MTIKYLVLIILIVSLGMGMIGAFAQEYTDNSPQELQIISLGNYDLEIKLPVSDGEDFSIYADFNEATNLQNLYNYILDVNDPLDELEFLKSEIGDFNNAANQKTQDAQRWNSDGKETLQYGIEWTYLRAFNDMERIITSIPELVNDGMSLESAFTMYDYILPPSDFENQTPLTVASHSPCGSGTIFDDASNSCVLDSPHITSNDDIILDLKKEITSLKLENRDLKLQIGKLQSEINELTDLLVNGLKEIYAWKSNQ